MAGSAANLRDAPDALARVHRRTLPLAEARLRDDTKLTSRWSHDSTHAYLPALKDHVIISYYGATREMVWRRGRERLTGHTKQGAITIIPQGQEGRWDIFGDIVVSYLFLPHKRVSDYAQQLDLGSQSELMERVGFEDLAAVQILRLLSRDPNKAHEPSVRLFVEHATDLLVERLVRGHSTAAQVKRPPRSGLADWQVRKVMAYMREQIDEAIGLDELANLVGLSRFHFCTAFRKATGMTPHAVLVKIRMDRAQQLLKHRDLPVTHVAFAVGYDTHSSFSAAFKKATGTTPTDFRKSL